MKVKDIMAKEVKFIEPSLTIKEAARWMKNKDIGALPVEENDRLVGVITDCDLTVRAIPSGHDIEFVMIRQLMTSNCLYCFEDDIIEDAAKNMGKTRCDGYQS